MPPDHETSSDSANSRPEAARRVGIVLCYCTLGLAILVPLGCLLPGSAYPIIYESPLLGAFQGWMVMLAMVNAMWVVLAPGKWYHKLAIGLAFWVTVLITILGLFGLLVITGIVSAPWVSKAEALQHHQHVVKLQSCIHAVCFFAALGSILIAKFWSGWRLNTNDHKPTNVLSARMITLLVIIAGLLGPVLVLAFTFGNVDPNSIIIAITEWLALCAIATLFAAILGMPLIWKAFAFHSKPLDAVAAALSLLAMAGCAVLLGTRMSMKAFAVYNLSGLVFLLVPLYVTLRALRRAGFGLVRYTVRDLQPPKAAIVERGHPLDVHPLDAP